MKKIVCILLVLALVVTPYTSFFAHDVGINEIEDKKIVYNKNHKDFDQKELYQLLLKNIEELKSSNKELNKKVSDLENVIIKEKQPSKKLNKFEYIVYEIIKFSLKTIATAAIYSCAFYFLGVFLKIKYLDTGKYLDMEIYLKVIQPIMNAVSIVNRFFNRA